MFFTNHFSISREKERLRDELTRRVAGTPPEQPRGSHLGNQARGSSVLVY